MRIQSQAEAFALRIASSEFPWRPHPNYPNGDYWHAPMENGHELEAFSTPSQPGWFGAIDTHDSPMSDSWHIVHPKDSTQGRRWPSKEHAMKATEQEYQRQFPIGANTGQHDSGVDYSNLNRFKDHL